MGYKKQIGRAIRESGLTVSEIAEASGLSRETVRTGPAKGADLNAATIQSLSLALGCTFYISASLSDLAERKEAVGNQIEDMIEQAATAAEMCPESIARSMDLPLWVTDRILNPKFHDYFVTGIENMRRLPDALGMPAGRARRFVALLDLVIRLDTMLNGAP